MTDNLPARRAVQSVSLDDITDLDAALRFCDVISQSGLLPAALRGNPANTLLVYLTGREMGLSLAQAVREIYVPSGGQPQMRGRLLLARLRQAGHDYWWTDGGDYCEFVIKRGDNGREYTARFTIDDALAAGLVWEKDGEIVALSRDGKSMPWMMYQADMLFWRAAARGVNRAAPEVAMGFDLMEAAPPPEASPPQNVSGPGTGNVSATQQRPAGRDTGTGPETPAVPSAETVAELAELDRAGQAAVAEENVPDRETPPGQPASREEQQRLSDEFARFGWLPRKHKPTILEACTAFCARPILAASDLTSDEVARMIRDMATVKGADTEAGPVALADRVEVWRQKVREADPGLAGTLFGG